MEKADIQRFREIPIRSLCALLGIEVDERGRCLCPFHDDRHIGSCYVGVRGHNTLSCWSCGKRGVDTIGLVQHVLGKTFPEACQYLAQQYGVILNTQHNQNTGHKITGTFDDCGHVNTGTFDAQRFAHHFLHPKLTPAARHFLFQERRISPRVASWYRLNSWTDRHGTNWLELPYYDLHGHLIGVQNRRLLPPPANSLPSTILPATSLPSTMPPVTSPHNPLPPDPPFPDKSTSMPLSTPLLVREGQGGGSSSPRFLFPPGSRVSTFGLQIIPHLRPDEELWIMEGPTDLLAAASAGHHGIAVASATLLRPDDFLPLRDRGILRWRMIHDNDPAGLQLRDRIIQLANQLGASIIATPAPDGCKDFGEWWKTLPPAPPVKGGEQLRART